MTPRLKTGKGITGLVNYVMGEGNKERPVEAGQKSRVDWIGGTGFPGMDISTVADVEMARKVMEFAGLNGSSTTRQIERDAVHLMLSWARGETPDRKEMEEAAHSALAAVGMANARAIFVAHRDEPQAHLHIVASRVNPETGLSYDLKGDRLALSGWAQEWEVAHGGAINLNRVSKNQLRDAIRAQDAGAVLDNLVQQTPTFTAKTLDNALGKVMKTELGRDQFMKEILSHPNTVGLLEHAGGQTIRYTTREAIEAERYALSAADRLVKQDHHKIDEAAAAAILDQPKFAKITGEQRRAFTHAIGPEGLSLIDGQAGTGKTAYPVTAVREAYEQQGFQVVGLAPTNKVAAELRQSGFEQAQNVNEVLSALNSGREKWDRKTVAIVDEAAMVSTAHMALLTTRAAEAGAKLILVGDDRQLDSIDRGGMFAVLKQQHGAAQIATVQRQQGKDERRASELMARGEFGAALQIYDNAGAIKFTRTEPQAKVELVKQWSIDTLKAPAKSRFVFAYTNDDVDFLNGALRKVREDRGELGPGAEFQTKHGPVTFSTNDRVQFTEGDKPNGITNGDAGTIRKIDGAKITVQLDGKKAETVTIDTEKFKGIRHGYAGTIYRGQGATLDQTYLMHSSHWRKSAGYVALTRHREKTTIFAATNNLDLGSSRIEPWMSRKGGANALSQEAFESAQRSYAKWAEEKPELAKKYDLASYVSYVQEQTAERAAAEAKCQQVPDARAEIGGQEKPAVKPELVALARQMARSEDRQAASSYHTEIPLEPLKVLTGDELARKFAPAVQEHYGKEGVAAAQKERDDPQLGKIAMNIRLAWATTDNAVDLAEALAANRMAIGRASAADVKAQEIGAQAGAKRTRRLKEGELIVVTERGSIYQLDSRLTNSSRAEIAHRLSGFDGAAVGSIAETKAALVQATREGWEVDRRKARPASKIENTIWNAFQGDFSTGLDKAGLTIARATEADVSIGARRRADEAAKLADKPTSGLTLPAEIKIGDLYAVTTRGHVFALNPNEINFDAVERRLTAQDRKIGSITETLSDKRQVQETWTRRRKDALDRRISVNRKQNFRRDTRAIVSKARRGLQDGTQKLVPTKAAGVLVGLSSVILGAFEVLANFFAPPPPLSRQQRELRHRSRLEQAERIGLEDKWENQRSEVNEPAAKQRPGAEQNPSLVREVDATRTAEQALDREQERQLERRWNGSR